MQMVLGRSYVLATNKGHMIRFVKDQPVFVPPNCVPDAVGIGARPADGTSVDLSEPEVRKQEGPNDPVEREKEIISAFELLTEQNARKDFTAAGLPAIDALKRMLGYEITTAERAAMWQVFNNQRAEAAANPDK